MTQRRIHQSEYPYFVTFRTRADLWLFDDIEYAEILRKIMINAGRLKRFDILAYQIMPDHVHILVKQNTFASVAASIHIPRTRASAPAIGGVGVSAPRDGCARGENVSQFMHCVKSYFAAEIRNRFGINYSVLQPRFYTRIVDTDAYLRTVIEYIRYNPVASELPAKYHAAPYQFVDGKKIKRLL